MGFASLPLDLITVIDVAGAAFSEGSRMGTSSTGGRAMFLWHETAMSVGTSTMTAPRGMASTSRSHEDDLHARVAGAVRGVVGVDDRRARAGEIRAHLACVGAAGH